MRLLWIAILAGVVCPATSYARVAILPVQGTNLTEQERESIGELIAHTYAAELTDVVVRPVEVGLHMTEHGGAKESMAALGVDRYVETMAIRLESRVIISAALRQASDGSSLHVVSMTALSLDDLEPVIERMVKALEQHSSVVATRTLTNVTAVESESHRNKIASNLTAGLRTGLSMPLAAGTSFRPLMSIDLDLRWERDTHFIQLVIGLFFPAKAGGVRKSYGGLSIDMGANVFLTDSAVGLYAGGGIQPRLLGGFDAGPRFAAYGQLGLTTSRDSQVRLNVDLRVTQNLVPFEKDHGDDVFPTELGLYVGLGF